MDDGLLLQAFHPWHLNNRVDSIHDDRHSERLFVLFLRHFIVPLIEVGVVDCCLAKDAKLGERFRPVLLSIFEELFFDDAFDDADLLEDSVDPEVSLHSLLLLNGRSDALVSAQPPAAEHVLRQFDFEEEAAMLADSLRFLRNTQRDLSIEIAVAGIVEVLQPRSELLADEEVGAAGDEEREEEHEELG